MNGFKAAISAGGTTRIGLWSCLADPVVAELLSTTGFDWMLLDGEHAPNDLRTLMAQLQATAAGPTQIVVRPPDGDPVRLKQFLDIGVQSLLIPMVDSPEQADAVARAVQFPPAGIRGVASQTRGGRWGTVPDYFATARDDICLVVQIESRTALGNVDAIVSTEGIDAVFVGPMDLAASLGHIGRPGEPEVVAAVEHVAERAHAAGKPVGILTVDEKQAARYIERGFDFVAVGMDTMLLRGCASELRARFALEKGRDR
ncbi:hypothetical protein SGFS_022180 [Streptomyces graminofaciens]|uniref:HpcH/HpaI aldolase/citrate lyase domain-containing protein n=1 Tax=Streptomyces graminofaciens TaxID=68212 RepID=A0ABN5VCY6_9ACTN|nr:HpcH/HpaI aldolase/citrate lyase family protein [Streptomyces graminofaciens]BBC30924.1 hypothetical protein SGFS_022180 [Streptomyces graminofaciens]